MSHHVHLVHAYDGTSPFLFAGMASGNLKKRLLQKWNEEKPPDTTHERGVWSSQTSSEPSLAPLPPSAALWRPQSPSPVPRPHCRTRSHEIPLELLPCPPHHHPWTHPFMAHPSGNGSGSRVRHPSSCAKEDDEEWPSSSTSLPMRVPAQARSIPTSNPHLHLRVSPSATVR